MELQLPFGERDGQIAVDLPGARAFFTTRAWGDVRQTQARIADRLRLQIVLPKQVHGEGVLVITDAVAPERAGEADAVITSTRGVGAAVLTADCLPIVIATPSAVAAVHAGWRGLAAGVIDRAVAALRRQGGGVLNAAIGPGAGACCYEVGDDLHRRFNARGQDFRVGRNLDLKAIARVQLMEAGVARIHDAGICTICNGSELTFSHRREGARAGRQAAIAWLS
jgi:YfiH family protein